jgi:hypothetical protein
VSNATRESEIQWKTRGELEQRMLQPGNTKLAISPHNRANPFIRLPTNYNPVLPRAWA